MLNFPGIYVYAFYPIPRLYIQIEYKLACCCRFKYFQLEIRKKNWFSVLSPLLSSRMLTILWLQGSASRAEPCFLPTLSLCSDEWLVMQVWSSKFHALIKSLCGCCFMNLLWIKLANSFILIYGCDSFFITMIEPKKSKTFSIQEKIENFSPSGC
jgi:hypothetical protein